MPVPNSFEIQDWGLIDYRQALERQEKLVEDVAAGATGVIVVCTHPHVVTLGRKSIPEDLQGWQGSVVEVSRGGRATYHGPSQIVIYPIIPVRDVHKHLRAMETAIKVVVNRYGVPAVTSAEQAPEKAHDLNNTGVWVGPRKIASIGVAIRKWVAFHGLALNVEDDPTAFQGIHPCGYSKSTMSSLEGILNRKLDRHELQTQLVQELQAHLISQRESQ